MSPLLLIAISDRETQFWNRNLIEKKKKEKKKIRGLIACLVGKMAGLAESRSFVVTKPL